MVYVDMCSLVRNLENHLLVLFSFIRATNEAALHLFELPCNTVLHEYFYCLQKTDWFSIGQ